MSRVMKDWTIIPLLQAFNAHPDTGVPWISTVTGKSTGTRLVFRRSSSFSCLVIARLGLLLGCFLALNSISGALERPPQDRAAVGGIKPRLTLLMRVTVCFPQRDHASTRPILHNQPRQRAFLERGSTANGLMTGSPGFNLSWKKKRRKDESPGGPRTNNPAAPLADHITG